MASTSVTKKQKITTLQAASNLIYALEESTKRNLYAIASTLNIVEKNKLYEEKEYKSTSEYAEAVHGYKRQTTQALIRVAQRFLEGNESTLKREGEKDFTVYQLMELLPMEDSQIEEAIEQGELNPYMTTKAIRDLAKSYKAITAKADEEPAETKPEEPAETKPEEPAETKPEEPATKANWFNPKNELESCNHMLNTLVDYLKGVQDTSAPASIKLITTVMETINRVKESI